jgi:hypothetical protein
MENKKTHLLPLWAGQDFLNDEKVILPEFTKIVEGKITRIFKGSKLIVEALDRGKKGWWVDLDSVEIEVFN